MANPRVFGPQTERPDSSHHFSAINYHLQLNDHSGVLPGDLRRQNSSRLKTCRSYFALCEGERGLTGCLLGLKRDVGLRGSQAGGPAADGNRGQKKAGRLQLPARGQCPWGWTLGSRAQGDGRDLGFSPKFHCIRCEPFNTKSFSTKTKLGHRGSPLFFAVRTLQLYPTYLARAGKKFRF